jgi:O-antigen/teichoic acid export membrane protein
VKEFLRHVSIYGLLPIASKFIGFFLVPIYARVFSSTEFGVVELLVTLTSFLIFACNLEFYSAIGRFFYEKENLLDKKILISTGLILTLIVTTVIVIIAFLSQKLIKIYYFNDVDYTFEYRVSLIWMFFTAIFTYLSVIPRYDKKPQLYLIINISSLLVRVGSTIFFVLILKSGIVGVIYGELTGAISATILNAVISKKYLGFYFSKSDAGEIIKYAVPIVPGILVFGVWPPLSRNLISKHFSFEILGLFSFAFRISTIMKMISAAIKLAWSPLLFENYRSPTFNKDLSNISRNTSIIALFGAISMTLLSPEICLYVGTTKFVQAKILIGFLGFGGVLEILSRLRGFGPYILKKTYITSLVEISGLIVGIIGFWLISDHLSLIGIGIIFILYDGLKYSILLWYTKRKFDIQFTDFYEPILMIILFLSILLIIQDISIVFRIVFLLVITLFLSIAKWKKVKFSFISNYRLKK